MVEFVGAESGPPTNWTADNCMNFISFGYLEGRVLDRVPDFDFGIDFLKFFLGFRSSQMAITFVFFFGA